MASPAVHRLQVLAAALLFSTGGTAVKATGFGIWQVACLRSGIAALALWLWMPAWRRGWGAATWLVGAAYATTMISFIAGNKLTTAANTIFLQATAPLYLLFLGPLLLREPVRRSDVGFAAALALGMGMFFAGIEPPRSTAPNPLLGNVIGIGAGLSWALTILGLRWLGRLAPGPGGGDPVGTAVIAGNVLAFALAAPLALPPPPAGAFDWLVVVYLGIFQVGLAYLFMARGVREVPALEVSLLLLLEPVASTLLAWAVHGERPGPWSLAGCGLILTATAARTLRQARRPAG